MGPCGDRGVEPYQIVRILVRTFLCSIDGHYQAGDCNESRGWASVDTSRMPTALRSRRLCTVRPRPQALIPLQWAPSPEATLTACSLGRRSS